MSWDMHLYWNQSCKALQDIEVACVCLCVHYGEIFWRVERSMKSNMLPLFFFLNAMLLVNLVLYIYSSYAWLLNLQWGHSMFTLGLNLQVWSLTVKNMCRLLQGGLPMYVATRGLYSLKPPTIFLPSCIKEDVEKLFDIHRSMSQTELNLEIVALDIGMFIYFYISFNFLIPFLIDCICECNLRRHLRNT